MTRTIQRTSAALALLTALAAAPAAQFGFGQEVHAYSSLYHRVDGDQVRVALEIAIDEGWHLYHVDTGPPDAVGLAMTLALEADGVSFGTPRYPEPHRFEQPGLGDGGRDTWILGHEGTIVIYALGAIEPGTAVEDVSAEIRGQTCEEACVLYEESLTSDGAGPDEIFADFPSDLTTKVDPGTPATGGAGGGGPGSSARDTSNDEAYGAETFADLDFAPREKPIERSLIVWLLFAFLAGALLNVMPCVLPVISIKVLSFVQQAGENRSRILALGLSFSAGILVVFLALAALAVTVGLSWGEQFQSEAFLIAMIGLVFAFSLSLFGVFELGVPAGVGSAAGMQREGLGDAFLKGMLATVLATPCTGPFLGSTLTWTLSQPPTTVFLIFTTLGLGMAVPYVILTANPAFLKILPRPGAWMETFKQAMGFVLLATVIYLMVSLRQDRLLFAVTFLVFVGLGCWVWGRFATLDQKLGRRMGTLASAVLVIAAGGWISFGWFQGLFVQDPDGDHVAWVDFEPDLLREHIAAGDTVFIDFTADWCPNCKVNERFVFESETIRGLIDTKRVVAMKADITDKSPRTDMIERFMEKLGARSIPFLAVFPGDEPASPYTRKDLVTVSTMREIFEACPEPGSVGPAEQAKLGP